MKRIALVIALVVVSSWVIMSIAVQVEATYRLEPLGGGIGEARALVLFHPSRDAHFSDELSLAVAQGFMAAGFTVDRATTTSDTPARPDGYSLIAVVGNTFYWTPDLPTLRYLKRAELRGITAVGLIGGGGATGRSQRLLEAALQATGATVLDTRSFWRWRPNDETRMEEPNHQVALDLATAFGLEAGRQVLAAPSGELATEEP